MIHCFLPFEQFYSYNEEEAANEPAGYRKSDSSVYLRRQQSNYSKENDAKQFESHQIQAVKHDGIHSNWIPQTKRTFRTHAYADAHWAASDDTAYSRAIV